MLAGSVDMEHAGIAVGGAWQFSVFFDLVQKMSGSLELLQTLEGNTAYKNGFSHPLFLL